MGDLVLKCPCGHRMRVSEYQVGMEVVCRQCKTELRITPGNTEPLEATATFEMRRFAEARRDREAETHAGYGGIETCSRCKKPFRGEWDRHETDLGVFCHICLNIVNQESGLAPQITTTASSVAPDTFAIDGFGARERKEASGPEEKLPGFMRSNPRAWRTAIAGAAAIVLLAALYYTFIEPEAGRMDAGSYDDPGVAFEVPHAALPAALRYSLYFSSTWLQVWVALYLALSFSNRLQFEKHWANAAHTGIVSLALAAISFTLISAGTVIATLIPMASVYAVLSHIAIFFITVYVLLWIYDATFSTLLLWLVMRPLAGLIVFPIEVMLARALSGFFT